MEDSKKKETKPQDSMDNDENMIIESSEELEVVKNFEDIGLREELLRGIYSYGFNKPSAI